MDRFRCFFLSVFFLFTALSVYADKLDEELARLKVADAERRGWDTLPEFRHYCRVMQGKMLKDLMVDANRMDVLLHTLYRESVERYSMKGWVKLEEISINLPQHATRRDVKDACRRMDSIYACLCQGTPFELFMKKTSNLAWRPLVGLLQEFSSHLADLNKGDYTQPFLSPLGVHIVRLVDRKPAVSYEEAYPYLVLYVDKLGKRNPALKTDLYAQWKAGNVDDVLLKTHLQGVKDRLLIAYWDEHNPIPVVNEKDLKSYFDANKEEYAWELPHYKGAVIRCQNKKMASRIRKRLKKLPQAQWKKAFSLWKQENPESDAVMEMGLFQIGKNVYVDKLAFKCGELPRDVRYPYVFVMGKRLKKGPEDYKDVRERVEKDYHRVQKLEQIKKLQEENSNFSQLTYKNR